MAGKSRNFVVIGLGTFGRTIAGDLISYGNFVLGIDRDADKVNALAEELSEAVIADGRDEEALREAGVDQYDVAVVAIGEDLESNVLCTMNLKLLGVEKIWAKALSRTHHRILTRLGADRVVHPEQEIGQHVAQMLHNPLVRDYLSLGNGSYIVDLRVPERLENTALSDLDLQPNDEVVCLGVIRGSRYIDKSDESFRLEKDDKLLLLGGRDELRAFAENL